MIERPEVKVAFVDALTAAGRARLGLDDASPSPINMVERAVREKVSISLYRDTKDAAESDSRIVAAMLRPSAEQQIEHLGRLRGLFVKMVEECRGQGIDVLLLKGIGLCECVYKEHGYRQMLDIDFLVREPDVKAVCHIMRRIGMVPHTDGDDVESGAHQHNVHWLVPHESDKRLDLDLECHWNIVPPYGPFPVKASDLWKDAVKIACGSSHAYVLCPEHFLLHACIHLHFHGYEDVLRDYLDIYALTVHNGDMNWDRLARQARRWNADSVLYLALCQMIKYFRVDKAVEEKIAEMRPRRVLQRKVVLPLLQRRVARNLDALDQSHLRIKSSPSDTENLAMALCGGRVRELVSWLWPSRERLRRFYSLSDSDIRAKHYFLYYLDMERRLVNSLTRSRSKT